MAISYQTGSGAVAQLGQQAGEAKIHEQARAQIAEAKMRKDMAQIEQQAFLQKFAMGKQMELESEMRQQSWEMEKMETRSRLDFQKEEEERQYKNQQYKAAITEIDKRRRSQGGDYPDKEMDDMAFAAALQHQGASDAAKQLGADQLTPYQQASLVMRQQAQEIAEQRHQDSMRMRQQEIDRKAIPDTPKRMTPNEIASATNFLSQYAEVDKPGWEWGAPEKILAKVDDQGNFEREATPTEIQAMNEVKSRLATGLKFGETQEVPSIVAPSTPDSIPTQLEIDALVQEAGGDWEQAMEIARQRGFKL